jgi:hypothetical protein
MEHLEDILSKTEVRAVTLLTVGHTPAAAFYARRGFATHLGMVYV